MVTPLDMDCFILVLADTDAAKLSKGVRELVYGQGQKVAGHQVAKEQARVNAVYEQAQAALDQEGSDTGEHSVKLAEGIDKETMSKSQRASYDLAEQIAPAVKADVLVYEGKQEWGYYDANTDTICLNINAKWSRVSMMTFTLAHELVHRAKLGSPAKFKAFANFLVKEYGKQGSNLDAMIAEQLAAAKKAGIKMDPDQAFEEVICDACQKMLVDTDAGKRLAEFGAQSEQNRNIVKQFGQWLKDLMKKLRRIFRNVEPDSLAAQEFHKFDDNVKQILADMFVDMSMDAGEKLSTIKAAGLTEKITTGEGGVRYKLNGYSKHQIENWSSSKSIVIYESEQQLRKFINDAVAGKNLEKKMYFGAISKELAARIERDTGLNVDRYNCTLRASEIRKIFKDHGTDATESPRGHRAITEDDIVAIPEIVQSPDEIRLSKKLFEGKPVVEFVKTINGKTTVAAYVSAKHLDLTVQTMYSGKNKGNLATAAGDQAPANTPEAHVGTVPNNNILNSGKNVNNENQQGKKSFKLPVDNAGMDKNSVDNSSSVEENGVTQNSTRGEQYDNRGIREGTAAGSEASQLNGRTDTENVRESHQGKERGNRSDQVLEKARKVVERHINDSPNSGEVYYYLLDLLGIDDSEITLELYNEAVAKLSEMLYDDAVNLHPVLFEDKWKIMGGSISDLRRSILDSADERAFKLPVAEDTSPRSLLANALETLVSDDKERSKIAEYKAKLETMEAEEAKLRELNDQIKELSFAKGKRDTAKIRKLRDEKIKTTNRINIYDKQLLRLEAAKPLQKVLERERKRAYDRAKQNNKEAMAEYKQSMDEKFDAMTQQYREQRKEEAPKQTIRHRVIPISLSAKTGRTGARAVSALWAQPWRTSIRRSAVMSVVLW